MTNSKHGSQSEKPKLKAKNFYIFSFGFAFCVLSFQFSCGSADEYDSSVPTQLAPYVNRVDPVNGKAGDVITIFGFGYSVVYSNDIVTIGGAAASASAYNLLDGTTAGEIESLTVTVPAGVTVGTDSVFVTVFGNTSNANVTFTVTE